MNLKPLFSKVLVRRTEAPDEVQGGIVIPDQAKTKSAQSTVVSVGPEVTSVKKGDSVLLPKFGGVEVTLNKSSYVLIEEKELLGILSGGA